MSKVVVARPVGGITLNSALEFLLDENGEVMVFDSEEQARKFLTGAGVEMTSRTQRCSRRGGIFLPAHAGPSDTAVEPSSIPGQSPLPCNRHYQRDGIQTWLVKAFPNIFSCSNHYEISTGRDSPKSGQLFALLARLPAAQSACI